MTTGQPNKRNSNLLKIAVAAGILLLLAIAAQRGLTNSSKQLLTPEQARQALLSQYPGEVLSLALQSGEYAAELETEQGRYALKLDASTGEIDSIVLLKLTATAAPSDQPEPQNTPAPAHGTAEPTGAPKLVSEQEAVKRAMQEVPGELDDVDTGIDDSGAYYLVDINTSDGREAVVQVDAITGGILSVTWEEPDDDHS